MTITGTLKMRCDRCNRRGPVMCRAGEAELRRKAEQLGWGTIGIYPDLCPQCIGELEAAADKKGGLER